MPDWQPKDTNTVNPYITVDDVRAALDFYERALGAQRGLVLEAGPMIVHAEIRIGDSVVMMSGEWPHMDVLGPKSRGGPTSSLAVYVPDADAAFRRAVEAGATPEREPEDQFYGDRMGQVRDPFGHRWSLHTHIEDVSEEEMKRRMADMGPMPEGMPAEAEAEAHPS